MAAPVIRPALLVATLLVGAVAACARRAPIPPLPPFPDGVWQVAVAEPANRTGHELRMDDRGAVTVFLGPNRSTVPELLAADLRVAIRKRRFDVLAERGAVPVLRVELDRWEADAADWSTVTVDLTATLVEPTGGRTLWTAARHGWVVPTPGAHARPEAFVAASRDVANALVAGWQPTRPARTK